MKSKTALHIAVCMVVLCTLPAFAEDQETSPVAAISFGAGTVSGDVYSGKHALFGGGADIYPFHKKPVLQRFALSLGFSRANLGAGEEFMSDFGLSRLYNHETQAEIGMRVDVLKIHHIEVSLYASAALARETQVFQFKDTSGLRDTWKGIGVYGYQCGNFCESSWNTALGKGISIGYVIQGKDYAGRRTRSSWTVPEIKFMNFGDRSVFTVGVRRSF